MRSAIFLFAVWFVLFYTCPFVTAQYEFGVKSYDKTVPCGKFVEGKFVETGHLKITSRTKVLETKRDYILVREDFTQAWISTNGIELLTATLDAPKRYDLGSNGAGKMPDKMIVVHDYTNCAAGSKVLGRATAGTVVNVSRYHDDGYFYVDMYGGSWISHDDLASYSKNLEQLYKEITEKPTAERYILRGECLLNELNFFAAYSDYIAAVTLEPESVDVNFKVANFLANIGRFNESLKYFDKVVELDPQNDQAYLDRGLTYSRLGENEKWLADFAKVAELIPRSSKVYKIEANRWLALGELARAMKALNKAIEIDPINHDAFVARAGLKHREGDHASAISDFTIAIDLVTESANVEAYIGRAQAYLQIGEIKKALLDLAIAEAFSPSNPIIHFTRGYILNTDEQYDRAKLEFTQAIRLNQSNPYYFIHRARLYEVLGEHQKAIRDFRSALQLDNQIAMAYAGLGKNYSAIYEYDQAIAMYDKAIELDPEIEKYREYRQWVVREKYPSRYLVATGIIRPDEVAFQKLWGDTVLESQLKRKGSNVLVITAKDEEFLVRSEFKTAWVPKNQVLIGFSTTRPSQDEPGLKHHPLLGKKVIVVDPAGNFGINDRFVADCKIGDVFTVKRVCEGEYVTWVYADKHGGCWLESISVVEYDETLDRLYQQIKTKPSDKLLVERGIHLSNKDSLNKIKRSNSNRLFAQLDFFDAINLNPENAQAYYLAGKMGTDHKHDEMLLFSHAIRLKPDYTEAYHARGMAHQAIGQIQNALNDFDKAIELKPDFVEPYDSRCQLYYRINRFDKAIDDANKVIELSPNLATGYNIRGLARMAKQEYDLAIQDLTKFIQLSPGSATARSNRGTAWYRKGAFDFALDDFTAAIEMDPGNDRLYYERGIVWSYKQSERKAIVDLSTAINLNPEHADAYCERGKVYLRIREFNNAFSDLNKAIELDPNAWYYLYRGNIWFEKRDYDRAIQDYTRSIDLDPGLEATWYIRALCWEHKRDYGKAANDFKTAVSLSPDDVDNLEAAATILATCRDEKVHDGKTAVEYATRICQLTDWKQFEYVELLAAAYAADGQFDKALQYLDNAVELDPQSNVVKRNKMRTAFKAKRPYVMR